MKSVKRASRILLWVSVLLSIPVMAVALNNNKAPAPAPAPASHPSAPAYHPSAPAYHPSAPAPSHPSYSPPASHPSYNPPASHPSYNPAPSHSYSPQSGSSPSAPVHSYTPGSPSGGNSSGTHSYTGGATTYTPHVYTPGSPATSHPSGGSTVSGEPVRNANGEPHIPLMPRPGRATPRQLQPLHTSTPTLPEPRPLRTAAVTLLRRRAAVLPLQLPRRGAIPILLIVRRRLPLWAATPSPHITIRQQAHPAAQLMPSTACRHLRWPASRARAAPHWDRLDHNPCFIR